MHPINQVIEDSIFAAINEKISLLVGKAHTAKQQLIENIFKLWTGQQLTSTHQQRIALLPKPGSEPNTEYISIDNQIIGVIICEVGANCCYTFKPDRPGLQSAL